MNVRNQCVVLLSSLVLVPVIVGMSQEEALFEAARRGAVSTVTDALACGININARDGSGMTLLHAEVRRMEQANLHGKSDAFGRREPWKVVTDNRSGGGGEAFVRPWGRG